MRITFLKDQDDENFKRIMSWEKMIEDQLVYISKNLNKHPVGTEERGQYIEIFTFWLRELLCIQNVRMNWVA
jgi:hypothetical protein